MGDEAGEGLVGGRVVTKGCREGEGRSAKGMGREWLDVFYQAVCCLLLLLASLVFVRSSTRSCLQTALAARAPTRVVMAVSVSTSCAATGASVAVHTADRRANDVSSNSRSSNLEDELIYLCIYIYFSYDSRL